MSLVSNLFLLFVAASILIYYIVPRKSQWIVLLIFSYLYYIAQHHKLKEKMERNLFAGSFHCVKI